MSKLKIGFTGPSLFLDDIKEMISNYFNAIPLYIDQNHKEDLEYLAGEIDGLVLAGGSDISPSFLGQDMGRFNGYSKFDIRRDFREDFLIDKLGMLNKPILGICRGFQILGVKNGFHLIPDISQSGVCHSPSADEIKINYEFGEYPHFIETLNEHSEDWFVRQPVNSAHHQALLFTPKFAKLNDFEVIATANTSLDEKKNVKIIELMQNEKRKIVACQFHCETIYKFDNIPSLKVLEKFNQYLKG